MITTENIRMEGGVFVMLLILIIIERKGINPGIICCISNISWDRAEELLKFCVNKSIQNIKFIPIQGRDISGNLLPYAVRPKDYADFL